MGNGKFAVLLAICISVGVAAWPAVTQKSTSHGVTVAVTPGNLDADASVWDFAVSFRSDGRKLADQLMEDAVLVAGSRRAKPLWWDGEGPGGTQRAGVLKFIAMKPRPTELELHIQRPGEPGPRVFHFAFGEWYAVN